MSSDGFTLSVQAHGRTSVVEHIKFPSIAALGNFIEQAKPTTDKVGSQGVVGALFNNRQRLNENISGCVAATLDFDKPINDQHFDSVAAILESEGIGFVAHNTWSNHGRFAVIIPFDITTDIAGQADAIDRLRVILGPYGNFADESSRPGQLRFVSPNPEYIRRVKCFEGDRFKVKQREVVTLAQPAGAPAPIPERASADRFAMFAEQASPEEKHLFLTALRYNLLNQDRLDDYMKWFPVTFACFRAWAVNSGTLTESQREMFETLDAWSKRHPKWKPDALRKKLADWVRDRGNGAENLHIQSLLTHETDIPGLREAIKTDETYDFDDRAGMLRTLDRMVGAPEVTVVAPEALDAAVSRLREEDAANRALSLKGLTILSRAPYINPRFAEFIDIVVALTTQNKAELWELSEDSWDFFLRPAPMIISLCQMYAMGFAPHTVFRISPTIPVKALNLYMLNIAAAGTGKSATMDVIHSTLSHTLFKNLSPSYKLHSATGLWINAFERHGPLQLVTSDEAESLIGKQGQKDQHLLALQTSVKQLYDEGKPGRKFRPSAQVQRELAEITSPHMSLNLAATPALLREDIGEGMLNDGFVSRMIVTIDDRESRNDTFEKSVARYVELITSKSNDTLENTIAQLVKFFHDSWRSQAADHPGGRDFFSVIGDEDAADLAARIGAHFENPHLPVRTVTPPNTPEGIKEFSEITAAAEACWETPPGARGTNTEANIESLRVRSATKLHVLSAILSLIADPGATEINLDLMKWAADLLYTTQHPFYRHLLSSSEKGSSMMRARSNPDFVEKLRPAVLPGGPLREGLVPARKLRNFSYAWRRLLDDLNLSEGNMRRSVALEILNDLEIGMSRTTNGGMQFFMTKGLPNE